MSYRAINPVSVLLACCTLGACSDSLVPEPGRPVTVSFATTPLTASTSATLAPSSASRSITIVSGANVLVINSVQLVLARMELVRAGATCAGTVASGDDLVDDDNCAELQLAPSLVTLPVDGAVRSVLNITVPAGSYASLEAKVRALRLGEDGGHGSQAFLAAHPDLSGVSVVVTGTYNGRDFNYRGAARAEVEQRFSPALTVASDPVNLTVQTDVTTWFKTQSGTVIDPSSANAGGANASVVADNIQRSFRAFRDDDRDGHDDDGPNHS